MKLKNIKFNNHKILGNLEVDFCNDSESPLNTVVIIGENGTGKTTLLRSIFESFEIDEKAYDEKDELNIELNSGTHLALVQLEESEVGLLHPDVVGMDIDKNSPKVVYMPAEINFDRLNKVDNTFKFNQSFLNVVDQKITENITSFIATKINKEIFKNRNKIIGEVIDKVCDEINSVFESKDLDVKLVGLSEDEDTTPIFMNSLGKKFDINGLSSGEKQLFLRALSLRFLEINNSIILIDEPEISLHPSWQQKIIKIYENIGENNQLIIATHSPHIVSDIKTEHLRILRKDSSGVFIVGDE